ncbi:MAG: hypothetical protein ABSD85_00950 [Acidimicrobiales bacterium]
MSATVSACGASTSLGNDFLAPLTALPATDVVFETNLQSAVQGGVVQAGLSGTSQLGGLAETSGAPATTSEVSVASGTGVSVYTAFNPVDRHCLGSFVIPPGAAVTVLGESDAGTYDFWFSATTATGCTASIFTTEMSVPSGWASGDPSSTGWPSA